jgi:hypothetical membrane protein
VGAETRRPSWQLTLRHEEPRARRNPPWVRIPALAWAGIVGPVLFTVAFLAQDALRRDEFSPVAEPVSALEVGPKRWVQQVNFLVFGLLTMAHAIGLHRGWVQRGGGWVGPALLFITGIGLLAAGTFPLREDAAGITYDPGGHTVAGMIFFLGSPATLIVLSRRMRHDPSWRGMAPTRAAQAWSSSLSP